MQQYLSFFGRFKRQKKVYGNYAMSQHADCYEKDKVIGYELTSAGIITLSDFV